MKLGYSTVLRLAPGSNNHAMEHRKFGTVGPNGPARYGGVPVNVRLHSMGQARRRTPAMSGR